MSSIASSSSSSKYSYIQIRNPTPSARRSGSMGRTVPQTIEKEDYPRNSSGLYVKRNFNFIYEQDLKKIDTITRGVTKPETVVINGYEHKQYILKNNYVLAQYLSPHANRTRTAKTLTMQYGNHLHNQTQQVYNSNSRVAIQIMYRNLLKFFLRNREDVILPDIHPVFDKDKRKVCGMISEKINFQEGRSVEKEIMKKFQETNIPSLMQILGIYDIVNKDAKGYYISNTGLMANKKLVFFDFGRNLLDDEYHQRRDKMSLQNISLDTPFAHADSLKNTREKYLTGYNTTNSEKHGLAETIHPDIEHIIMSTGPGDENFRKEMAKIIQTRINNAFIVS